MVIIVEKQTFDHSNYITELQISHKLEATSVSGCSTPTGRKMREPGQRNLQNSTFSISRESHSKYNLNTNTNKVQF